MGWDKKDCMEKASKHLRDKSIYGEVTKDLFIDISINIKSASNYMLYNTEFKRIVMNLYVKEP